MHAKQVLFRGLNKILKNKAYAARLRAHAFASNEWYAELLSIHAEKKAK